MSEDSPVESNEKNSQRIKDHRVNNEDYKRRRQPTPRRRGVQSGAQDNVPDSKHTHQYQYQRQHEHTQYCAGEAAGGLRRRGTPE